MNHRKSVGKNVKDYCDVEITREWYGDSITGEKLKERESKTSHAMDAELRNGNK